MARDQWIIKNQTNRYLSIGDLQKLPALWPGKVLNLLNYYEQDSISNSFDLKFMINQGWLKLTKIKNGIHTQHASFDGQEAITTAEKNEVDDVTDRVQIIENSDGASVNFSAVSKSSNYTIDPDNDRYILVDASGGNITISLPSASDAENKGVFEIKKTDSSSNLVIIDGNGSETIDGSTTVTINVQYEAISIVSNGTEWFIL